MPLAERSAASRHLRPSSWRSCGAYQPAERQLRMRDALRVPGRFRPRERIAQRALRAAVSPSVSWTSPRLFSVAHCCSGTPSASNNSQRLAQRARASSSWPRFLRLMPMLLSVLPRSSASSRHPCTARGSADRTRVRSAWSPVLEYTRPIVRSVAARLVRRRRGARRSRAPGTGSRARAKSRPARPVRS